MLHAVGHMCLLFHSIFPYFSYSLIDFELEVLFLTHKIANYVYFNHLTEGKRPLGRPRRRWEDNIKMDLQEVGRGGMDWIDLSEDRDRWRALVNAIMNLRIP